MSQHLILEYFQSFPHPLSFQICTHLWPLYSNIIEWDLEVAGKVGWLGRESITWYIYTYGSYHYIGLCIPWYSSKALASACSLQSVFCSCGHLMHTHMHPQDIININHIGIIDRPKVKCDKINLKADRTELSMLSMKQEKGHQGDHSSWSHVDNTKYKHGRAFTDMTSAHIYEESLHYWCFFL